VASRGPSFLARVERRLMHLFGPADVKAADSRRPEPPAPPAPTGPVIIGEHVETPSSRGAEGRHRP